MLFFEYDYPTPLGLRTLEQIRKAFPQLPLFMVTEEHSEDLAVWAFRTGVRDFLIKPIEARDITSRLQRLPEPRQSNSPARSNILPQQSIPPAARYAAPALPKMTARAVRYMESRLQERITLEQMALFCGMSPFQLSRAFKREHGVNFKEFLTRPARRQSDGVACESSRCGGRYRVCSGFFGPVVFRQGVSTPGGSFAVGLPGGRGHLGARLSQPHRLLHFDQFASVLATLA